MTETLADRTALVRALLTGTRSGKVVWERIAETSFRALVPGVVLHIFSLDSDGVAPFRLTFIDEHAPEGSDEFSFVDSVSREASVEIEQFNLLLAALYRAAEQSSFGQDPLVKRVMEGLKQLGIDTN